MSFLFCVKSLRTNGTLVRELSGRPRLRHPRLARRRSFEVRAEISLKASVLIFILCVLAMACGHRSPEVTHFSASNIATAEHAININTASTDDLQRIPHMGEKVAAKILEHRETNGPFRRVEHLMLIQGISDARFRKIRPLVRVE